MDAHFDNTVYHPSFGPGENLASMAGSFFHETMSHFQEMAHEYNLPDDVVQEAVHGACDFMHMDDLQIKPDNQTCVYTHNPTTLQDDVLGFSREQMLEMGVHDSKTLSLICTHEAAHCALQYLSSSHELSNWQEELSCDAFMGVRAAVEDIDTAKVEETLRNSPLSGTHPNGDLRVKYIEIGRQIGEELKSHDVPVTAENIMARLDDYIKQDAHEIFKLEAIVNEQINRDQGLAYADGDGEQKGYTQADINRHISKAKHDMGHEESLMRHCKYMIESKIRMGEPCGSEKYEYEMARRRYNEAKDDLWKWEHTHAEESKSFMDDTTIHEYSESEKLHSYTQNDVDAAYAEAERRERIWRNAHDKTDKVKTEFGSRSYEYEQAKKAEDEAARDMRAAEAKYQVIADKVYKNRI